MEREALDRLLPAIYQPAPGSPLDAILESAAGLLHPIEDRLKTIETLFDPLRAPEAMLPFLAHWVDLDRFLVTDGSSGHRAVLPAGQGRLRELCAAAASLSKERGTRRGLLQFLERATGATGFELQENIDRNGQRKAFHLLVTAPATAKSYEALIHAIVIYEKPAYVTYDRRELRFRERHEQ